MVRRMIIMLICVAIAIGALGFIKYRQVKAAIAHGASYAPPPEAVTTIVATLNDWQATINSIGTVTAEKGVIVSADLPGIVAQINFESGKQAKTGEVLVRLDTRQEEAQLAGAVAQQRLTHLSLDRAHNLRARDFIAQADLDQAEAEARQADANVNQIKATIERKTIRAPFSGILGIRQVNLGQYVNPGQAIVPLQSLDPVYVDFAVPQQEITNVHVGDMLNVSAQGSPQVTGKGRITAINSVIDESTRNIDVRATLPNPDGRLFPGMFVQASVYVGKSSRVIALPASSISYTPYGDFVFIVDNMRGPNGKTYRGVRQQLVKLGEMQGDQVAITDGVQVGQEIVSSGVFKLRNGAAVVVNNEIRPSNNPRPNPEEN